MIHTLIVLGLTSLIWGSALYLRHYLDKRKKEEEKRKQEEKEKDEHDCQKRRFQQLAGIKRGKRYRVTTPRNTTWDDEDYDLRFNLANMV